jgi:hypothetical protein
MAYSDLLATDVIQGIIDDLADVSTLPAPLLFVNRIPSVEAEDGEIIARYNSRVTAAEIIMDDQKAIVKATRPLRLQRVDIPKIKHGTLINESMQNVLARIDAGNASRRDVSLTESYVARTATEMRQGVYHRMETMLIGMALDSFSYDKLGIKITAGSWGMPSDLKVTPLTLWTTANAATMTPIADIMAVVNIAKTKYGIEYNRLTMSTTVFELIVASTEFRNKSALYAQLVGVSAANFPTDDTPIMRNLMSRMLNGMTIETYDQQVWFENNDGSESSQRYLPENKVILGTSIADNARAYWDWGNAVVPETRPGNVPLMIGTDGEMGGGGFDGERSGPIGYATAADPHGNPPGQIIWAVGRGYPRKYKETITAVITAY